jgi:hypothetical protein
MRTCARALLLVVALVGLTAVMATGASAATITVTTTRDSGPGSLRQAISDATGGDTIAIPSGVYMLSSVLTVAKSLTFSGAGARTAILDGQNSTPVFSLQSPAAAVSIMGLTLRNGKNSSGSGGAIDSAVPLTLTDDAIVGNTSTTGSGGGVAIRAQLTMDRDLVAGNSAPAGDGGGVELEPPTASTSTISDTTIAQNEASNTGGGIDESNTSTETLKLLNDTIAGNTLTGASAQGGGFRAWSGTTLLFGNTVLVQNSAATEPTCAFGGGATVTSEGHNVQDGNDPNCNFSPTADKVNTNPQLGPLADNGGPTSTLLPAAGSPLIDAGDAGNCTTADQRGVPRPQRAGCDIGAVERSTPTVGTPVATAVTAGGATLTTSANTEFIGGSFTYRYGTTAAYGASTAPASLPSGAGAQAALATLSGLAPSTTYHAQLVLITADGTATSADIAFTTSAVSPPPPATLSLSHVGLTHKRFCVGSGATAISAQRKAHTCKAPQGTTFTFTLSAAARVTLVITHQVTGLRRGRRCVAPTRALRRKHARACQRTLVVGTLTRANEPAGADELPFSGRVGHRALHPGAYRATLTAKNATGAPKPAGLSFTIVK